MTFVRAATLWLCAAPVLGCGGYSNDDIEFLYALPSPQALESRVPTTGQTQGGLGQRRDGLAVGDPSPAHEQFRDASENFNALLFNLLDVLERVRKARPTERGPDRRAWGPFDDPKDPRRHIRVVMERHVQDNGEEVYAWRVELKRKADAEVDWVPAITGSFAATSDLRRGEGFFTFDAQAVRERGLGNPGDDKALQRLEVTYATAGDPLVVEMRLLTQAGELGYSFERYLDGRGAADFVLSADLFPAAGGSARETLRAGSRWTPSGAGRADLDITGGDLGTDRRVAVECWDEAFRLVYRAPFDFTGDPLVGDAAACAVPAP